MQARNPSRWKRIRLSKRLPYRWLYLVGLCLLMLNAQLAEAQPAEPDLIAALLSDGQWVATFQVSGPISGPNFSGTVTYVGRAEFTSSGGEVSGGWTMIGTSQFSGECFEGTGELTVSGVLEGGSDQPLLRETGMGGVGTSALCTGQTMSGPIPIVGPMADLIVVLNTATCTQVVGEFTIASNLAVGTGGASSDLVAPFVAIRVGGINGDPERYFDDVRDLQSEALRFQSDLEGGAPLDLATLDALIGRAEGLSRGLRAAAGCGLADDGGYNYVLTGIVEDIIRYALAHPEQFSTSDLYRLILAGVRVGAIGSGALGAEGAEELANQLGDEVHDRLDETEDCIDLTLIMLSALALGEESLAVDADIAAAAACGG
jgi:hypothetical protein